MQPIIEHELSLYTASDEMTETEPDFEDCTQPMHLPPWEPRAGAMEPHLRSSKGRSAVY
jgi:ABC-type cobalt transport system substrate-binding protein